MRRWDETTETPVLKTLAGKLSLSEIAQQMHRPVPTIRAQIKARGLPSYHHKRRNATRRQLLMAHAAGIW